MRDGNNHDVVTLHPVNQFIGKFENTLAEMSFVEGRTTFRKLFDGCDCSIDLL